MDGTSGRRGARRRLACAALLLAAAGGIGGGRAPAAADEQEFAVRRKRMVDDIAAMTRELGSATGAREIDARVMAALGRVPRHQFVPESERPHAYENRPLPIGHGQTISQPYIVAAMTELLDLAPGARVLEIGTGSGYQAAILAELGMMVFSIEIIEPLARQAAERLQRLGYGGVRLKSADGYFGWAEHAPFDAIIVTAAAGHVPPPLVRQLKPGGRMVIPVGAPFLAQHLTLIDKRTDGTLATRQLLPVRFVPLTGGR